MIALDAQSLGSYYTVSVLYICLLSSKLRTIVSISLDTTRQESNLSREETANYSKDSMIFKLYLWTISQKWPLIARACVNQKRVREEALEVIKISVKK